MLSRVPRAADLPVRIGLLPSGPTGSVLDVPGVGVGHATVWRDEPPPPHGRGVARTGVTVLDPGGNLFRNPVPAGGAVLNGAGECTGFLSMQEWGLAETPVFLTSTMQVGRVLDAACELLVEPRTRPSASRTSCSRWWPSATTRFLSDARRMQVDAGDVREALSAARASVGTAFPPDEGAVGAGTGMTCLGWKGGIGTSSRVLPSGHTVGVLVLTNFGEHDRLTVGGVNVGPAAAAAGRGGPHRRGRLVHRGRGHRRAAGQRRLPAAGPPGRARAGPHRQHGLPRERRDLPGPGHRPAVTARRAAGRHPGRRAATWTRSSPPPSRRPRRRCSPACSPRPP